MRLCHDGTMEAKPESVDGPKTMERLDGILRKVLTVSHEEILRREAAYKRQSEMNPLKRGVKPGVLNHTPRARKNHPA